MEINAEMNRVFGVEMARIFSASISEDEIKKKAAESWSIMTKPGDDRYYNSDKRSEFQKIIGRLLSDKVEETAKALIETDEYKEIIHNEAECILNEIRQETHMKMVDSISSRLCGSIISYDAEGHMIGMSLRNVIDGIMHQR